MELDAVYKALFEISEKASPEELKAMGADKSSALRLNVMRLRRYWKSESAAEKFGFIGVGRISFADARLKEFNRRVARISA